MRAIRASVVYVPTGQKSANFSFLRANVPRACQFFNLACQRPKACQFFKLACQRGERRAIFFNFAFGVPTFQLFFKRIIFVIYKIYLYLIYFIYFVYFKHIPNIFFLYEYIFLPKFIRRL